jgi:hypothetical protein
VLPAGVNHRQDGLTPAELRPLGAGQPFPGDSPGDGAGRAGTLSRTIVLPRRATPAPKPFTDELDHGSGTRKELPLKGAGVDPDESAARSEVPQLPSHSLRTDGRQAQFFRQTELADPDAKVHPPSWAGTPESLSAGPSLPIDMTQSTPLE